jgi:hypothetical protein
MSVTQHIFLLQMTRGVSRSFHHVTLGLPNCSKRPVPAWPTNEILPWKTFCFRRKAEDEKKFILRWPARS